MDDERGPRNYPGRPGSESIVGPAIMAIAEADSENDDAYREAWVGFWQAVWDAGWRPPRARWGTTVCGVRLRPLDKTRSGQNS
jgi:hypothetical protein